MVVDVPVLRIGGRPVVLDIGALGLRRNYEGWQEIAGSDFICKALVTGVSQVGCRLGLVVTGLENPPVELHDDEKERDDRHDD